MKQCQQKGGCGPNETGKIVCLLPCCCIAKAHHLIRNVSQSLVADWTAAHDISPSNGHDVGGKKTSPSDVGAAEARPVSQISDRSFLNSLLAVRGKGKAAAAAVALAAARGEARPLDDKEVVEQTVTFMQAG